MCSPAKLCVAMGPNCHASNADAAKSVHPGDQRQSLTQSQVRFRPVVSSLEARLPKRGVPRVRNLRTNRPRAIGHAHPTNSSIRRDRFLQDRIHQARRRLLADPNGYGHDRRAIQHDVSRNAAEVRWRRRKPATKSSGVSRFPVSLARKWENALYIVVAFHLDLGRDDHEIELPHPRSPARFLGDPQRPANSLSKV